MKSIINKIKNMFNGLDDYYGTNTNNKKDFIIAYIILPIMFTYFLAMAIMNQNMDRFFIYTYLLCC